MKATLEKESKAIEQGNYDLIKGDFTPEEALEIINHLLFTKINFHNLRNFSLQVRFNMVDEASSKRIEELKICQESIKALVKEAKLNGKSLRVKSNIMVELV